MNEKFKLDATNQSMGRLASKVAILLRGKNSPFFEPHVLPKNKVTVFNLSKLKFTGKKLKTKIYYRYTGYPGGIKSKSLNERFTNKPEELFRKTVMAMLPKNRIQKKIIKNLNIYRNSA